ncbi:hypothetical protein [Planococcus halocryophilus]|uniref:hypothetical protein n=1 Tax=Planococcus halocryophilus TaxID=1215089 RepID=UPI002E805C58|nr:hypothetical protein [Planococcus halocryophilus]
MKNWIYPLMVVVAASCYGVLSTIIKVAMKNGFTAAEAVTSQYFIGFAMAALLFLLHNVKCLKSKGGKYWLFPAVSPLLQDRFMRIHLISYRLLWRLSCFFNSHGLECS